MTPHDLAKSGSEHAHQVALFAWLGMASKYGIDAANDPISYEKNGKIYVEHKYGNDKAIPLLAEMYAIPNGGERNKIVAARLKAEGVKAGTPDTHLPVGNSEHKSLYIEMKKVTGTLCVVQKERIERLRHYGNAVAVCYSWEEAVVEIITYITK